VADESVTKSGRWSVSYKGRWRLSLVAIWHRVAGMRGVSLTGVPIGVSGSDVDRPNGKDQRMTQTDTPSRPDPLRRLWYTFGGGLGSRYREWVLHDITSPTRWVRQVARAVVQAATMGALAFVVLGTGWITWVSLIGGLSFSLVYYVAFFDAFAEHRLCQHGYPWGTAKRILNECDRRRSQFGCAAMDRSIAAILADDSLNDAAMIRKRLNSGIIGTRQQRNGHRSPRVGQPRAPVMPIRCSTTALRWRNSRYRA
jgi:hypothetical protein